MASVMSKLQLYSLKSRKCFEKIKVSFIELSYKINNHQAVDERYIWSKSFNWKLTCYFRFYWRHQSPACFLIRRQRSSRTIAASIKLTSRWSALLPEPEGAAHSAGQSGQWTAQRVLWHAHTHKKKKFSPLPAADQEGQCGNDTMAKLLEQFIYLQVARVPTMEFS